MSKKQPVKKFKAGAGVTLAVWENEGKRGTFFTFTIDRVYREGDELKNTSGLRAGDLLNVASACKRAQLWAMEAVETDVEES